MWEIFHFISRNYSWRQNEWREQSLKLNIKSTFKHCNTRSNKPFKNEFVTFQWWKVLCAEQQQQWHPFKCHRICFYIVTEKLFAQQSKWIKNHHRTIINDTYTRDIKGRPERNNEIHLCSRALFVSVNHCSPEHIQHIVYYKNGALKNGTMCPDQRDCTSSQTQIIRPANPPIHECVRVCVCACSDEVKLIWCWRNSIIYITLGMERLNRLANDNQHKKNIFWLKSVVWWPNYTQSKQSKR